MLNSYQKVNFTIFCQLRFDHEIASKFVHYLLHSAMSLGFRFFDSSSVSLGNIAFDINK